MDTKLITLKKYIYFVFNLKIVTNAISPSRFTQSLYRSSIQEILTIKESLIKLRHN